MGARTALINGGGIGGLAAAAALAQRGVDVEVAEIKPNSTVLGVGINQPGNSLRALDSLGVLERCLEVGYAFDGNEFRDWQDREIVFTPSILGDDRVPANAALTRSALHGILLDAALDAGARIRYSTTIERFADDGDGVQVRLSDGSDGRYDLLAGFDGVRSPIRRRLFGDGREPVYAGYGVWRMQLARPDRIVRTTVYQGDRVKGGLIPLSQTEMYLFLVTPEPGNPRFEPADFPEVLRARLAGFGGIVAEFRDGIDERSEIVYSPILESTLDNPWSVGRVIVLGDAAHSMAPHLTQGAAMAIEDAVVLADEVTGERGVAASLQAVTDLRHERAKFVVDVSHAILEAEMQVTAENMPYAIEGMRAELPGQTAYTEQRLNEPFRSVQRVEAGA